MISSLHKFYSLTVLEQNLIIGLTRGYRDKPETRETVHNHYSDALKILERHESDAAEMYVSRRFEYFIHVLLHPTSAFTHAANEFWAANVDIEEFVKSRNVFQHI